MYLCSLFTMEHQKFLTYSKKQNKKAYSVELDNLNRVNIWKRVYWVCVKLVHVFIVFLSLSSFILVVVVILSNNECSKYNDNNNNNHSQVLFCLSTSSTLKIIILLKLEFKSFSFWLIERKQIAFPNLHVLSVEFRQTLV